jgi:alpha-glucan,water dikinase
MTQTSTPTQTDLQTLAAERLQQVAPTCPLTAQHRLDLTGGVSLGAAVAVDPNGAPSQLVLVASKDEGTLWLHWGAAVRAPHEWRPVPEAMQPAGSKAFDERALRSPFTTEGDYQWLHLQLDELEGRPPRAINFVLYDAAADRWLKQADGGDLHLPFRRPRSAQGVALEPIVEQIVEGETGDHSWTLMHRFNLAYDLLDEVGDDPQGVALIFVWLRYSALRQLDWQRKYNTKPRELAHAQDRLTQRLAELYQPGHQVGALVRLTLSTVGRGGEGQRVRDEILHIMHRHHVKERHGTFLEQWHQKLHNNTTPDDIGICQAYMAFLCNGGDLEAYWRALDEAGITQARLAGFERPITEQPQDWPEKRDGLLHDMSAFLRLLKSVHSGQDLETSIDAAAPALDEGLCHELRHLAEARAGDPGQLADLARRFVSARRALRDRLANAHEPRVIRDLLYVDLGLETQWRAAVEQQDLTALSIETARSLMPAVLDHLLLNEADEELDACHRQWHQLPETLDNDLGTLQALSVVERTSRAVRDASDALYALLQPKAEQLGRSVGVEQWTISLFSEEVVRGTLLFVLGRCLRHLEPALHQRAGLGGWQIISPGQARGKVRLVEQLRAIQDESFGEPMVIVADDVSGDEEIPAGVGAVVTRESPDLVSHVAVRARNEHVLLASCLEPDAYQALKAYEGQPVQLSVDARGELSWSTAEATASAQSAGPSTKDQPTRLAEVDLTPQVLSPQAMTGTQVGGKSLTLARLRPQLPDWLHLPPFIALSFGVFNAALADKANKASAREYETIKKTVDDDPAAALPALRAAIEHLQIPPGLLDELQKGAAAQGLTLPGDLEKTRQGVTRVWASKWTERAYWSRRRLGIDHDTLHMAVLIQAVVPCDYAFVLHTVNPMTGDADQLYGEVVLGLGETLVSNEPGRPLAFSADKKTGAVTLHTLPSKRFGLYGQGVIYRSDSNGEDLAGYAGAGLYESVLGDEPEAHRLDYTESAIVHDAAVREQMLHTCLQIGLWVEKVMDGPQDIEGGFVGQTPYLVQTRPQVGL